MNNKAKNIFTYGFIADAIAIIGYASDVPQKLGIPDRYAIYISGFLLIIGVILLFIAFLIPFKYLRDLFASIFPEKGKTSIYQFIIDRLINKERGKVPDVLFKLLEYLLIDIDEMNDILKGMNTSKIKGKYNLYKNIFYRYLVSFVNLFDENYHYNITIHLYLPYQNDNERYLKEFVSYGSLEDEEQLHNEKIYILHSCRINNEPIDYALNSYNYYNQYADEGFMKNSIFDYLTDKGETNWISNDLRDDIDNNIVFMSCYNDKYQYNSLAVFSIVLASESLLNNESDQRDTIGILTIESIEKNAFSNKTFYADIEGMKNLLFIAFKNINWR